MLETQRDLQRLQEILDASRANASRHLREIFTEARTLRAPEIAGLMSGMRTLTLATVTARGEPRVSAVDGHFRHARWVFSTSRTSAKAVHLRARPAVSASYLEGEELGVFTHGHAFQIPEGDEDFDATLDHLTAFYGSSPLSWGDTGLFRLEPSWMIGYAADREALLAARGVHQERPAAQA